MIAALVLAGLTAAPAEAGNARESLVRPALVARIDATGFQAHNGTLLPQLVLIGAPGQSARARLVIPPLGAVEHRFPAGTLSRLGIEVLARSPEGIRTSGFLPLDGLHAGESRCVWIGASAGHVHAWSQGDGGLRPLSPQGSALSASSACAPRCAEPAHVPVITPAGKKKGDAPPQLEKKPLPPL